MLADESFSDDIAVDEAGGAVRGGVVEVDGLVGGDLEDFGVREGGGREERWQGGFDGGVGGCG